MCKPRQLGSLPTYIYWSVCRPNSMHMSDEICSISDPSDLGRSSNAEGGEDEFPRNKCPVGHCDYRPKRMGDMLGYFRSNHSNDEIPETYTRKFMARCRFCQEWVFYVNKHVKWCSKRLKSQETVSTSSNRAPRQTSTSSECAPGQNRHPRSSTSSPASAFRQATLPCRP